MYGPFSLMPSLDPSSSIAIETGCNAGNFTPRNRLRTPPEAHHVFYSFPVKRAFRLIFSISHPRIGSATAKPGFSDFIQTIFFDYRFLRRRWRRFPPAQYKSCRNPGDRPQHNTEFSRVSQYIKY